MFRQWILGRLERQRDGTYLVPEKGVFGTLYALNEADAQRYADRELRWLGPFAVSCFAIMLAYFLYDISGTYVLAGLVAYGVCYVSARVAWIRKTFGDRRLVTRNLSLAETVSQRPLAMTITLAIISVFFVALIVYALLIGFARGDTPPLIFFPFLLFFSGTAWMSIAALIFRFRKGVQRDVL